MFNLSVTKMNHSRDMTITITVQFLHQKYVKCCRFLISYILTHLLNFKDTTKYSKEDGTDLNTAYVKTNQYHLFIHVSFQRNFLFNKDFYNSKMQKSHSAFSSYLLNVNYTSIYLAFCKVYL